MTKEDNDERYPIPPDPMGWVIVPSPPMETVPWEVIRQLEISGAIIHIVPRVEQALYYTVAEGPKRGQYQRVYMN